jgi:hypothetical protein
MQWCHPRRDRQQSRRLFPPQLPPLGAAKIVGPVRIEHREQSYLGLTSSGRRKGGMIPPPNVVYLLHQAPTTSIPLNPLGAKGWQVVPALV